MTIQYYNDCNTQYPGSSKLNIYPGGHCCWNNYYNTAWHDPSNGLSVWEFMLESKRVDVATPLPVNFLSIDIKKENDGARLSWKVADEENVSRYEVEKSADARSFRTVGSVPASGQSAYSFAENNVLSKSYFRIRSVDNDGKYKFSSILSFSLDKSSIVLKAFPIPSQNDVTLQHPTAETRSRIMIHSVDGRLLKTIVPSQHTQQTHIDCTGLQPGAYFIRYDEGDGNQESILITKTK